jgi:hypothetical protein
MKKRLVRCQVCQAHVEAAAGASCPSCGARLGGSRISNLLGSGRSAALAGAFGLTLALGVVGCEEDDNEPDPSELPQPVYGAPADDMSSVDDDMAMPQPEYGAPPFDMEDDMPLAEPVYGAPPEDMSRGDDMPMAEPLYGAPPMDE